MSEQEKKHHYQFRMSVTIQAESEDEARFAIGEFMTAATIGEQNPVEDYSIDELEAEDEY